MRIWLPIIIITAVLSAAFSWLSIQLAASNPMPDWKRVSESNLQPGKFEVEATSNPEAGYSVKRDSTNANASIQVDAGKRAIDQEHSVEIKLRNDGQGPIELVWTNDPTCGCVRPVLINDKELEPRKAGATIEPGKEAVMRIRWKANKELLPPPGHEGRGYTINLYFEVRNDSRFINDYDLTVSVVCKFVRPPMEGK